MSVKSKSVSQPFPVATHQITGQVLPKLKKRRKKNLHTKNPFKTKVYLIPDDSVMKVKKLDGFLLLKVTNNDMPHEIIRANLSRLRIIECSPDDFRYFINLEELNISENQLLIEQLTTFPSLIKLSMCANGIQEINLTYTNTFARLRSLDLSFNYIDPNAINSLAHIPQLEQLMIANNELQELPASLESFQRLTCLDISDNNFSSNYNAQQFWFSLATIPNLQELNISKNFLRGIHTERLIAGNFSLLRILDFSYNVVENQHNLICARNFKSLEKIIVTGNPFAMYNETQGIEMEIHARTGGKLINEEVPLPYLRKPKKAGRPQIRFDKLNRVEEDYFRIGPPQEEEKEEVVEQVANVDHTLQGPIRVRRATGRGRSAVRHGALAPAAEDKARTQPAAITPIVAVAPQPLVLAAAVRPIGASDDDRPVAAPAVRL